MRVLDPGQVTLSDRRTRSSWTVELAGFSISRTPVTQCVWSEVIDHSPALDPDQPQHSVSWWDAATFCNALSRTEGLTPAYVLDEHAETATWDRAAAGYRLPTEAEWEYACRAGTTGPRYGPLDVIAWYRANSAGRPHHVGTRSPNGWGLHDMLGNVWEWCWDFYDTQVYGSYRVLRGGGWADEQWSLRASVRRRSHPTLRIDDVGVRLARSTTQT